MHNFSDHLTVDLKGHVTIRSYDNFDDLSAGRNFETVLDKDNAVHRENASILIARGLADRENGSIYYMAFGNGGAVIDPIGSIVLNPPNVSGSGDLYNQTYEEAVDDRQGAPGGNLMAVRHITGTMVSEADIICVIGTSEPLGQQFSDNIGPLDLNTQQFAFSEIGLKTKDHLLITHVTFAPILKSSQRLIEVVYTLIITVD